MSRKCSLMECRGLLSVLLLGLTLCGVQAKERPFILVSNAERGAVLEKIENAPWAKEIYSELAAKTERQYERYAANPEAFLRQLPYAWTAQERGEYPPFLPTENIDNGVRRNLDLVSDKEWEPAQQIINYLQMGINCGMVYYITQDEKYAQCAVDILYNFVKGVQQNTLSDWHGRGGWLFPDDGFREVREIGVKVPLVYDFVAEYIKSGAKAYDMIKQGSVTFPLDEAQDVMRTYADISIHYGHTGSNHPVLEAPSLVYNALAMDDEEEREKLLSYFVETSTEHQDALPVFYENFATKGDIWPETSQYLNHSTAIIARLMLVVNRYDPSLRLGEKYPNVLHALPRLDYFKYPNGQLVRWGDGKRTGSASYSSFEDAYQLAKMDGLDDVKLKFGALINGAVQQGKYRRRGMQAVFWYDDPIIGDPALTTLPRTDRVYHAGIFMQRNVSETQKAEDGLMGFVGGAHMIHGHAEGMNMELYGEGLVLGVDHGRGKYGLEFHENYSRIYAAHNTVIVNGSSQGEGGWQNLGINTVELIAMEPAVNTQGVSPYHSFTQTRFLDDKGDKAEAEQERTLALVRTSPTTGYYVDVFRSKSKLPHEYHDYLYHNIGDTLLFETQDMGFRPTPERYMSNANAIWGKGQYRNPGWHYFKDVMTSRPYTQDVKAQFPLTQLAQGAVFMNLFIPGTAHREYSHVMAPHTYQVPEAYEGKPTPTLVIRQQGEAWKQPFVVVYEPYAEDEGQGTITNVEKLEQDGVYNGLKITSRVDGEDLVQYILTLSKDENYVNEQLGIAFKGLFAVITCDGEGELMSLYLGEGESLKYKDKELIGKQQKSAYQDYTK